MKHITLLIALSTGMFTGVAAQENQQGAQTRHRFAEMYLGADLRFFPGAGTHTKIISAEGALKNRELDDFAGNRLLIGATHFWGHADFFVAIPVTRFKEAALSTGVETGGRYFPWKIEKGKLRPWLGISLASVSYHQGEGTKQTRFTAPLSSGASYRTRNHLIEFSATMDFGKAQRYYISRDVATTVSLHKMSVGLSYKYLFDVTLSAEKDWQSGRTQRITDTLAALNRLNGFTIAAGPSSAFYLKKSDHNTSSHPWLGQHKSAKVFPDLAIGYYWHKPDLQLSLAYRPVKSELKAYGYEQKLHRKSITLEAYKFIGDYHGFVPFIGPSVSYEHLSPHEKEAQATPNKKEKEYIRPGITFGWDIRPNRIQSMLLRTNLRWIPDLNISMKDGKKISFEQLEFNFIQLVVFPGRMF